MTWQEQTRRPATFRGIPFLVAETEARIGRRTVVHEYPQRDKPFTEDLGRRARVLLLEAHVVGADYLQRRDALIKAIEAPGPGQLVHPRHGELTVVVQDYVAVKESHREGGMARLSISFVEHGENTFPAATADTVAQVEKAASAVDEQAVYDFGSAFDVDGPGLLAADALATLQTDLDATLRTARLVTSTAGLAQWMTQLGSITGSLTGLMRTPVVLAQSLIALQAQLVATTQRPTQALAEFESVFNRRPRLGLAALSGATRARLLANANAQADLARRMALASAARMVALALSDEFMTAARARALLARLTALVDAELEGFDPVASVASALGLLRAAAARDVADRAELLLQASTYTPVAVLPAVVLAHRVYQDATRADELVARNAVRHPAFVPAAPLEVLR